MIDFIGTGSAFNVERGNTSAFFRKDKSLLLIDCGGGVFHELQKLNILNDVEKVYIIITHTHPDHVGSLGDLIFYSYYILKNKVNIFFPEKTLLEELLTKLGVTSEYYNLNTLNKVNINDRALGNLEIDFLNVTHVNTIPAYGFVMNLNNKNFYYSGDSNNISKEIIDKLKIGEIQRIYQDTCGLDYEGNGHLSLKKLCGLIPEEFRSKIYCMHLDQYVTEEEIKANGFNIA
ncbi:Beta-lactamase superfamily domain-containing protein [Clostridium cavendishii DSM 21758]|uniref:Beta-lactamase superfamily domain-containing protein n=1 Tax=Clostridium cavendishii DSM 21758 TaxID=1121302 RepID=A0A1M6EXY5_9CLOT|nr:MBL fold metallo-hydrolase [Clostridium cavendishii]SHI90298.1 Beta-lactamase superfamily domain-containing protein [Clostridium cavendishii DSM 21758]